MNKTQSRFMQRTGIRPKMKVVKIGACDVEGPPHPSPSVILDAVLDRIRTSLSVCKCPDDRLLREIQLLSSISRQCSPRLFWRIAEPTLRLLAERRYVRIIVSKRQFKVLLTKRKTAQTRQERKAD
jgi:hypothetical protein